MWRLDSLLFLGLSCLSRHPLKRRYTWTAPSDGQFAATAMATQPAPGIDFDLVIAVWKDCSQTFSSWITSGAQREIGVPERVTFAFIRPYVYFVACPRSTAGLQFAASSSSCPSYSPWCLFFFCCFFPRPDPLLLTAAQATFCAVQGHTYYFQLASHAGGVYQGRYQFEIEPIPSCGPCMVANCSAPQILPSVFPLLHNDSTACQVRFPASPLAALCTYFGLCRC